MDMNVVVTGGAGFVGRHVVHQLIARGDQVVVYDNLMGGDARYVPTDKLVIGDVGDVKKLAKVLVNADAVIHLAARVSVTESMVDPAAYYATNVVALKTLLDAVVAANVPRFVFASSAAVYAGGQTLTETSPVAPVNVYGATKVAGEAMVNAYAQAYDLTTVVLRFFNVAGATRDMGGDRNSHLIVNAVRAAVDGDELHVYGDAVRDYVHVVDVAGACVQALTAMKSMTLNVAGGQGYTTREVVDAVVNVTGQQIRVVNLPARAGEPQCLTADVTLAQAVLRWTPVCSDLWTIVRDVWRWS